MLSEPTQFHEVRVTSESTIQRSHRFRIKPKDVSSKVNTFLFLLAVGLHTCCAGSNLGDDVAEGIGRLAFKRKFEKEAESIGTAKSGTDFGQKLRTPTQKWEHMERV